MKKLNLQQFGGRGSSSGAGGGGGIGRSRGSAGGRASTQTERQGTEQRRTNEDGVAFVPHTRSEIVNDQRYVVNKYSSNGQTSSIGVLSGEDVKSLLNGYTFDGNFGMWYSSRATIAYDVRLVDERRRR